MGIQVIELTQNKDPWEKEFVDFEFDGKHVSDFGLVVAFGGDRLSLTAFPEFEDETSEINGATGQLYWGTRFGVLKRTYTLVTDGITEEQLNAFRVHFAPGKYGKFVEDHLIHRYSYCRVSEAANFEVIPFRKEVEVMGYKFLTNEYKGEIQITFTWDEPFFYGEENYINGITEDKAAEWIRVVLNNKTPLASSWHGVVFKKEDAISRKNINSCCLGTDKKIVYENDISSLEEDTGYDNTSLIAYYNPSSIEKSPILSLTYSPILTEVDTNSWKPVYFANIADDINIGGSKAYNEIEISQSKNSLVDGSVAYPKQEEFTTAFKYTSPNVIRSIHRAIQIAQSFYNKKTNQALIDLEEALREEITHNKVIGWLAQILNFIEGTDYVVNGILQKETTINCSMAPLGIDEGFAANWFACFNYLALCFFCERSNSNLTINGWTTFMPYQVIFNGENNTTKIIYSHNESNNGVVEKFADVEENCGDMTCSPYLKLAGGDTLDSEGKMKTCHYLRFRKAGELYQTGIPSDGQVKLEYKYCYM